MKITCYLVISDVGDVRVNKRRASAGPGEVILPLTIDIPYSAFARYLAAVTVDVPESPQYQAAVGLREDESE